MKIYEKMKTVINENTIKQMVKESLIEFLTEFNGINENSKKNISTKSINEAVDKAFNKVVNESMDEISTNLAFRAAAKANGEKRYNQGNTFTNYANNKIKEKFGRANVEHVNAEKITYFNMAKARIVLDTSGCFNIDRDGTEYFALNGSRAVKTDKVTARIIAQWWSTYGDKRAMHYEKGLDWHYWAAL